LRFAGRLYCFIAFDLFVIAGTVFILAVVSMHSS